MDQWDDQVNLFTDTIKGNLFDVAHEVNDYNSILNAWNLALQDICKAYPGLEVYDDWVMKIFKYDAPSIYISDFRKIENEWNDYLENRSGCSTMRIFEYLNTGRKVSGTDPYYGTWELPENAEQDLVEFAKKINLKPIIYNKKNDKVGLSFTLWDCETDGGYDEFGDGKNYIESWHKLADALNIKTPMDLDYTVIFTTFQKLIWKYIEQHNCQLITTITKSGENKISEDISIEDYIIKIYALQQPGRNPILFAIISTCGESEIIQNKIRIGIFGYEIKLN